MCSSNPLLQTSMLIAANSWAQARHYQAPVLTHSAKAVTHWQMRGVYFCLFTSLLCIVGRSWQIHSFVTHSLSDCWMGTLHRLAEVLEEFNPASVLLQNSSHFYSMFHALKWEGLLKAHNKQIRLPLGSFRSLSQKDFVFCFFLIYPGRLSTGLHKEFWRLSLPCC